MTERRVQPWAWIVVCEYSIYRRAESFVRGPIVGRRRAIRWVKRWLQRHPFGECLVRPATAVVLRGDQEVEPTP